jgi:hypothetical protein
MTVAYLTKHLRPAAWLAVALVTVVTFVPGGARAAGDENAEDSEESPVVRDLMQSLGLRNAPSIEYRERSPLVVPPRRDLPPPQSMAGDKKNSALPADLGVSRPSDIASRRFGSGAARSSAPVDEPKDPGAPMERKPTDFSLGKIFSSFGRGASTQEIGTFKAEPPRTTLTEPPPGYQTPSPAAPYGITSGGKYDPPEVKDPGK